MRRLNVTRNLLGPKPKWKFIEKTGKLERKASRGGIDGTIDEDTEKILGLLNDLSRIFIPYIYTVLYTACRKEFSLREEFSCEDSS